MEYFPNVECTYEITVPEDYRILLTFDDLKLQPTINGHCFDYLRISASEASLCGSDQETSSADRTFESSENWMRVIFSSDHVEQYSGFSASYQAVKSCFNRTYDSDSGTLTSINYPNNYLNHQDCFFFINISDPSRVIYLQFEQLHTKDASNSHSDSASNLNSDCISDFIEIYDGVHTHRRCGNWLGCERDLRFKSHGTWFRIHFVTDGSGTASGYKAIWKSVENDTALIDCPSGWIGFQEYCYKVRTNCLTSLYLTTDGWVFCYLIRSCCIKVLVQSFPYCTFVGKIQQ